MAAAGLERGNRSVVGPATMRLASVDERRQFEQKGRPFHLNGSALFIRRRRPLSMKLRPFFQAPPLSDQSRPQTFHNVPASRPLLINGRRGRRWVRRWPLWAAQLCNCRRRRNRHCPPRWAACNHFIGPFHHRPPDSPPHLTPPPPPPPPLLASLIGSPEARTSKCQVITQWCAVVFGRAGHPPRPTGAGPTGSGPR